MVEDKINSGDFVYGRRPVWEALEPGRGLTVNKIWILKGATGGQIEDILQSARRQGIVFQWVDRRRLNEMVENANHQGVVARVSSVRYETLEGILSSGSPSPLLLLDGIEDPHNLGAVLRNAVFFGAAAVIVPRWRSAGMSGAVLKSSAGAAHKIPLIQVTNLAQTLLVLKEKNYWVYGADTQGSSCKKTEFTSPFALVIGNEGRGLHRLVKERCDFLVSIPGSGHMESLNASCAAGVLMYEIFTRPPKT